jgi:hypothetical protein
MPTLPNAVRANFSQLTEKPSAFAIFSSADAGLRAVRHCSAPFGIDRH